jgi:hypothetical protein
LKHKRAYRQAEGTGEAPSVFWTELRLFVAILSTASSFSRPTSELQKELCSFVTNFITITLSYLSFYFLRRKQLKLIYRQLKDEQFVKVLVLPSSDDISKPRQSSL